MPTQLDMREALSTRGTLAKQAALAFSHLADRWGADAAEKFITDFGRDALKPGADESLSIMPGAQKREEARQAVHSAILSMAGGHDNERVSKLTAQVMSYMNPMQIADAAKGMAVQAIQSVMANNTAEAKAINQALNAIARDDNAPKGVSAGGQGFERNIFGLLADASRQQDGPRSSGLRFDMMGINSIQGLNSTTAQKLLNDGFTMQMIRSATQDARTLGLDPNQPGIARDLAVLNRDDPEGWKKHGRKADAAYHEWLKRHEAEIRKQQKAIDNEDDPARKAQLAKALDSYLKSGQDETGVTKYNEDLKKQGKTGALKSQCNIVKAENRAAGLRGDIGDPAARTITSAQAGVVAGSYSTDTQVAQAASKSTDDAFADFGGVPDKPTAKQTAGTTNATTQITTVSTTSNSATIKKPIPHGPQA